MTRRSRSHASRASRPASCRSRRGRRDAPTSARPAPGSENRSGVPTPPAGFNYWSWGPTLTATLPLYRAPLGDAVEQAEQSVKQAEAQFEQARQDLIVRVAQAYFDVLAAQD